MDRRTVLGTMGGAAVAGMLSVTRPKELAAGTVEITGQSEEWKFPESDLIYLRFRRACDEYPTLNLRVKEGHELFGPLAANLRQEQPARITLPMLRQYLGKFADEEWGLCSGEVEMGGHPQYSTIYVRLECFGKF